MRQQGEGCGGGGADVIVEHTHERLAVVEEHPLAEARGQEGKVVTLLLQQALGT